MPNRLLAAPAVIAALALSASLPATAAAATQSAPVIHEHFTLLPCPGKPRTTLQIEGCAEHKLLALDKQIDAVYVAVFKKLPKAGRADLIKTNNDWLAYRKQACTTEASIYQGGTIQPVAFANCEVAIDTTHLTEVKAMETALSPEG